LFEWFPELRTRPTPEETSVAMVRGGFADGSPVGAAVMMAGMVWDRLLRPRRRTELRSARRPPLDR
jgi:hypothetical protein